MFGHPEWNLIDTFLSRILIPIQHAAPEGHGAEHAAHHLTLSVELGLIFLSLAAAGFGIWLAFRFYSGTEAGERPRRIAERFPLAYKLVLNKYYVDELYDATVVRPIFRLSQFSWKTIDTVVIDGVMVNGTAFATELTGDLLRFLQTGNVRNYALSVAIGILALALILW
jgi:NADH-quinone oxidoreductase subunit L